MLAITNRDEVAQAYAAFAQTISAGGVAVERIVGHKGTSEWAEFLWHENLQLWVLLGRVLSVLPV
jgi:hypothetical protein